MQIMEIALALSLVSILLLFFFFKPTATTIKCCTRNVRSAAPLKYQSTQVQPHVLVLVRRYCKLQMIGMFVWHDKLTFDI